MTAAPAAAPNVLVPARGCDCRVCPFFTGNPTAVEPICSGCNSDCTYCGCSRTEGAATPGGCRTCPIRCGSRTDIEAWMRDVGGTLRFDDISIRTPLPLLPRFIPLLEGSDVAELDRVARCPAYGFRLRQVFSARTHQLSPSLTELGAHAALGLRDDQLAVLVGYGEDPLVEAFWTLRKADRLIEAIAAQGWDLVLAPNFSMYGNQPRAEHLINFRRSLMVAEELAAAGVAAVPNLYWFRREDLERWVAWCEKAHPPAIALNLQTLRTDSEWQLMGLPGLSYLAAQLPPGIAVIVNGSSRASRIVTLRQLFGRVARPGEPERDPGGPPRQGDHRARLGGPARRESGPLRRQRALLHAPGGGLKSMRRRCFYLMGHGPTGAAVRVVGALGIEGPSAGAQWESHFSWIPLLEELDVQGWREDLERARGAGALDEDLVEHWLETANGITRDITEVESPEAPSLALAVEALVDLALVS